MKYRYSVVSGQTNVDGRNQRRTFLALIDSGADQIMMPAAIAEAFGIDRDACPKRTSLGVSMEPIDGFVSQLTFHIAHQADTFEAPVIFIDADVPVLLGREGFFDRYRIKFEQDHDTFEINPATRYERL
jgi:hypothetical protein